ncbi:hypothetical protein V6N13_129679 [Hibiscus sabdariffa]|uniref:GAGA-binding transcriptional activator n=1 Tax=Hibiscus sabdariffa TaxID=183260 RepID=A0ABR2SLV7_9ROSI
MRTPTRLCVASHTSGRVDRVVLVQTASYNKSRLERALRQSYKWGNGGWQSSCCTTALSMYPLPAVPNKKHARISGRKMSENAFNRLLTRLAAEGYGLSNPVDLKHHWAKHGTSRYITIK